MTDFEADMDSFYKIAAALRAIDEGKGVDTGAPCDIWITLNGVEYHLELKRSINRINLPAASKARQ